MESAADGRRRDADETHFHPQTHTDKERDRISRGRTQTDADKGRMFCPGDLPGQRRRALRAAGASLVAGSGHGRQSVEDR
jgi:hypothetical protein